MSRPISDAQIYMLLWAAKCTYGMFSELHDPPHLVYAPDGRRIRLLRTACDRLGLLGLGKRGLLHNRAHGLWEITEAGRSELKRPRTLERITAMADATAADDRAVQDEHDAAKADGAVQEAPTCESAMAAHKRERPGSRPRAMVPSSETLRFQCSEAESAEIHEACARENRVLSDVTRELLLAWARQGHGAS